MAFVKKWRKVTNVHRVNLMWKGQSVNEIYTVRCDHNKHHICYQNKYQSIIQENTKNQRCDQNKHKKLSTWHLLKNSKVIQHKTSDSINRVRQSNRKLKKIQVHSMVSTVDPQI